MNIEPSLTSELKTVAAGVDVPLQPPVAELIRQAEREQRRTRTRIAVTAGLVAAAVVAVFALAGQIGRPNASPTPAPQPTGTPNASPPKVPYLWNGTLYAGGSAYPGTWTQVVVRGESAVAVLFKNGSPTATLVVLRNQHGVDQLQDAANAQPPQLSWDGTKLAYVESFGNVAHLVVRDLVTGRELGRLAVDPALFVSDGASSSNTRFTLLERVDDNGTVHYSSALGGHAWTPGKAPVAEKAIRPWSPLGGFPSDAQEVQLRADGAWGAWLQSAPGAKAILDGGTATTLQAQHPGSPGSRVVIRLPEGRSSARDFVWESPTELLVTVDTDQGSDLHFIRCSIVTRGCKAVPTPPIR